MHVRAFNEVGAGIGHVTSDILNDPVAKPASPGLEINDSGYRVLWKGIADRTKSVTFFKGALQSFDPVALGTPLDCVGYLPHDGDDEMKTGFDRIWCQWCLGHLKDDDLVQFPVQRGSST